MNKQHIASDPAIEARIARFGLRIAAGLNEQTEQLPPDISERLRFAREQALLKAKAARMAAPATTTDVAQVGQTLALMPPGRSPRWFKLASIAPLLLLLAGLVLIQHSQWYQQILAAAEVDTALLSKPLPPAAYSDPGFREYLDEGKEPNKEQQHEE